MAVDWSMDDSLLVRLKNRKVNTMTDKVQKIKDWISKEQDGLIDTQGNFEYPEHEGAYNILCNLDTYIDSLQEEPVSEDLEEEIGNYIKMNGYDGLDSIEEVKYIANHFAKWQKENLWKPADGEDLPEIDREVVAFQEAFPTDVDVPSLLKIVMAHRPNPKGYDGKSIATGKVEHYTPKTYDKGGWNIPDVKYWLDVELPKEIEL